MIRPIVQLESPVLRGVAAPITEADFGSSKLLRVLADMRETVESIEDAVALAAPQIDESLRIFVISERYFPSEKQFVFINPKIIRRSSKNVELDEGCLSVRWKYGKVDRAEKVTIEAWNQNGVRFTRGASGLLSQVFQHETDHLDGTLFIDHARNIEDVPPEKQAHEHNEAA